MSHNLSSPKSQHDDRKYIFECSPYYPIINIRKNINIHQHPISNHFGGTDKLVLSTAPQTEKSYPKSQIVL